MDKKKTNSIKKLSFEQRQKLSQKMRDNHPEYVPVIVESTNVNISRYKFIISKDSTVYNFILSLRKYISNLQSNESIFIFVNNNYIPTNNILLSYLDHNYANIDGFLYIYLTKESTFG
jgi:hypothetical protein